MNNIFFLLAICYMLFAGSVNAQSATEGASPLRDSVKQKVAEELAEIKKSVTKKAFLGTITVKSEATLTMNSIFKESRTIMVGTDTVIKLKSGRDGTIADLKTADYILVMGDADGQNVLTAKRLLVITSPLEDKREMVYGTVSKKTASSITVTYPAKEDTGLKLTSSTKYSGTTKAADIKEGSKITAISLSGTALVIYLFP